MPKSKYLDGKPHEPVLIEKIWFDIPKENGKEDRYLISKPVADYIEKLENELSSLKTNEK